MIVTNNPLIVEKYENVLWVDGTVERTLLKVRDLVHQGYELVSSPLPASLRMLFSPYRSVIVGRKNDELNFGHVELIENSIYKYKSNTKQRKTDEKNQDDYQKVDLLLLEAALKEEKGKWY